jgi:hypothetical protein
VCDVIAGLDPAIHQSKKMDARVKPGHDRGMDSPRRCLTDSLVKQPCIFVPGIVAAPGRRLSFSFPGHKSEGWSAEMALGAASPQSRA